MLQQRSEVDMEEEITANPQARPKSLTPRLLSIAEHIRPCATVVDVGTDHGYLPVYLVQQGHRGRIIACDIAEKPLAKARENLGRRGIDGRVEIILCDGIPTDCGEIHEQVDIVIAGMGGETISYILENANLPNSPSFAKADVTLLLQPMSRAEKLENYLTEQGFTWQVYQVAEGRRNYKYYLAKIKR